MNDYPEKIKARFGDDINKGDLVIFTDRPWVNPCFYVGRGRTGNYHFYPMHELSNYHYMITGKLKINFPDGKIPKPKKISTGGVWANIILKIDPKILNDGDVEHYQEALEALKSLNIMI